MSRIDAVQLVIAAINRENYGGAEMLTRQLRSEAPDYPWGPFLMAVIANHLRAFDARALWVAKTTALLEQSEADAFPDITQGLDDLAKSLDVGITLAQPSWLIIKSWGYGFWADI
ncbi:MAG: hypothetical protein ACKVKG_15275, partial [Alphaproteobacteria bacterium]